MTNFCYNFVILSSIHFQILLFLSINICTIIICTYLWCSSSLTAFDYFDIQSAAQDNIVGPTKTRSGAKGIYYSALGFFSNVATRDHSGADPGFFLPTSKKIRTKIRGGEGR